MPGTGGGIGNRGLVAALLLAPACVVALLTLVRPTMWTFGASVRSWRLAEPGGFTGENFEILGGEATGSLWFTLLITFGQVVVTAVLWPLLALATDAAGRLVRLAVRVAFSLPLALTVPTVAAAVWQVARSRATLAGAPPQSPETLDTDQLLVTAGFAGAVLCGVVLLLMLPALRRRVDGGRDGRAVAVALVLGVLAAVAAGLQAFTVYYMLGPGVRPATIVGEVIDLALRYVEFGSAAVIASLLLLVLMLLGVGAAALIVLTGVRLELQPAEAGHGEPSFGHPGAVVAVALLSVPLLIGWFDGAGLPTALTSWSTPEELAPGPARLLVNTTVPPLLAALFQVGVAFLAALGIGGLRPLGRASEWLLLPFAPWLLVTVAPLAPGIFSALQGADRLGGFDALIPRVLILVPALFALTLFFKGRQPHVEALLARGTGQGTAVVRGLVVPALPLALLLVCAGLLLGSADLLWPLVVAVSVENMTTVMAITRSLQGFGTAPDGLLGLALVPGLVVLPVLIALQVRYLDRLVLRTRPEPAPAKAGPPDAPSAAWPAA